MTRWVPLKTDVLDALADEVLHNYGRGRAVIAVAGHAASAFADDFAAALGTKGREVQRATIDASADGVGEQLAGAGDAVLVVDGDAVLRPGLRGHWNYSVWLDGGDRDAASRAAASAIVDNSDAAHPRRVFADSC